MATRKTKSLSTATTVSVASAASTPTQYGAMSADDGINFPAFAKLIQSVAKTNMSKHGPYLFHSKVHGDRWQVYLNSIPEEFRQHYNCNCCKSFVQRYLGLCLVSDKGELVSILDGITTYDASFLSVAIEEAVQGENRGFSWGPVMDAPFSTKDKVLGTPTSGSDSSGHTWHHLAVKLPAEVRRAIAPRGLETPGQAEARMVEEFGMLTRAIEDYRLEIVEQAVALLKADALYRGEKILGVAEWFKGVLESINGAPSGRRKNLLMKAVYSAPTGFCHVRSSMIGTLLDDLKAGTPLDVAKRKFKEKMDPLAYMRTSAPIKAGAVKQAETLFETMGLAPALQRRRAGIADLELLWSPSVASRVGQATTSGGGVFGHLLESSATTPAVVVSPKKFTLEKFRRDVLPFAEKLQVYVRDGHARGITGLTTAVDREAPRLFQWESPVSWYLYVSGGLVQWNLKAGWTEVTGITFTPNMYNGQEEKPPYTSKAAIVLLAGAKDARHPGLCLFPEILRSELRPVRAVVEAHAAAMKLQDVPSGDQAIGLKLQEKDDWNLKVRVTQGNRVTEYEVDRWE